MVVVIPILWCYSHQSNHDCPSNRIGNASFELNGKNYQLFANNGANTLHGGQQGFDKKRWTLVAESQCSITLQYIAQDLEENFPGKLIVQIKFVVTEGNELKLEYSAELDKDSSVQTIVNLTNHTYFNLSGAVNEDAVKIRDHKVSYSKRQSVPHQL